jgi:hypothetical protein
VLASIASCSSSSASTGRERAQRPGEYAALQQVPDVTDFFLNGADTARPVRFVALYDPHVTPCWRPFPPASA